MAEEEPKTFTQEEVNAMMGKVRREVTEKFKDYDDLKTKATAYDEAQEAAKSELQKATERAEAAEKERDALKAQKAHADLAAKVSTATGVPAQLIQGNDEESMTAYANAIAAFAKSQSPTVPKDKGGAQHDAYVQRDQYWYDVMTGAKKEDSAQQEAQIAPMGVDDAGSWGFVKGASAAIYLETGDGQLHPLTNMDEYNFLKWAIEQDIEANKNGEPVYLQLDNGGNGMYQRGNWLGVLTDVLARKA